MHVQTYFFYTVATLQKPMHFCWTQQHLFFALSYNKSLDFLSFSLFRSEANLHLVCPPIRQWMCTYRISVIHRAISFVKIPVTITNNLQAFFFGGDFFTDNFHVNLFIWCNPLFYLWSIKLPPQLYFRFFYWR